MRLIERVAHGARAQLQQTAALPPHVPLDFDSAAEAPQRQAGQVIKTSRRTVIGLQGTIAAREIVRRRSGQDLSQRSRELAELVPRGANYTFELVAYVGLESLLRGQRLQEIQRQLAQLQPAVRVPSSTLYDQQQKFLFLLGQLHRQAAPRLRSWLDQQGGSTWLLDGTLETDSPVFLGIRDAASGILLESAKIPSENADDIAPFLAGAAQQYGPPNRVLHDLSPAMRGGCEAGLPGVPHFVCHYHLVRDVGEDLYREPQDALNQRLRSLKVQIRMRDQRKVQNERLRQADDAAADGPGQRVLEALLSRRPVDGGFSATLGREVLLAFHYWILDYRSDGRRRGYPFDPYTLYLHRRLLRAGEAMQRLLSDESVACQAPIVLRNFGRLLSDYGQDAQIRAAAALYERAYAMFERLREALWLTADAMSNLRQLHDLPPAAQQQVTKELETLRQQLRKQSEDEDDPDASLAATIVKHLDKYWSHLVSPTPLPAGGDAARTTNALESDWSGLKRGRRRLHGRGKLTRDFYALPPEYVLLLNLENPIYIDLVLDGSVAHLAAKFSQLGRPSVSFSTWRRAQHRRLPGELPRQLLRQDGFIDDLVAACQEHCHNAHAGAA